MGGTGREGATGELPAAEAEAVAAVHDRPSNPAPESDGGHKPPLQESSGDDAPPPFDESAESAYLAEARERGETAPSRRPETDVVEETDPKALPSLDELVKKIPAEVRETLEELFRARFVTVKRVPKRALKS